MKHLARLIGFIIFLMPAMAFSQSHEPAGMTQITNWPFNTLSGSGWSNDGGNHSIVSDPAAPLSPPNVYQQTFASGMPGGISPAGESYAFSSTSREVYLRFWWKANAGWQAHPSGINKIVFVSTQDGQNPFVLLMYGTNPYNLAFVYQNTGIDNGALVGFPGVSGTALFSGSAALTPGNWYQIELYMKLSTTTTSQDGILQWWANGVPSGNYTTVNYGQSPFSSLSIYPIWGGVGGTKTQTDFFQYDHMYVSIGQSSSPPPPPPPPPSPTDVGTVSGLAALPLTPTSVTVQLQTVGDGQGGPAKYDIRVAPSPINWGTASSVTNGTCSTPYTPNSIGEIAQCTITGLTQNTAYQVQLVPYRGTLNQGAVFGSLSNVASVTTPSASNAPTVSSFLPNNGLVGDSVAITGTQFVAGAIVKFNGIASASVSVESATSITATVPQGATTGTISVETPAGSGTSAGTFIVSTTATRPVRIAFSFSGLDVNGNREIVDHFNVYRAPSIGGTYAKVGEVPGLVRFFLDPAAPPDRACYKFEPVDTSNNVGAMNTPKCVYNGVSPDADATNPSAPFSVVPTYQ